jgi:hypothetical protein
MNKSDEEFAGLVMTVLEYGKELSRVQISGLGVSFSPALAKNHALTATLMVKCYILGLIAGGVSVNETIRRKNEIDLYIVKRMAENTHANPPNLN